MFMKKSIKVKPFSKEEERFMKLMTEEKVNPGDVVCRLGDLFGKPYNEYIVSNSLYKQIKKNDYKKMGL